VSLLSSFRRASAKHFSCHLSYLVRKIRPGFSGMVINSEILEPRQAARIFPAWNPRSVALYFVLANDLIGKADLRSNNAQHNIFWIAYGAVAVLLCLATKGELGYRGHRAHALDRSASVVRTRSR
jgi:hypothetical protein